MLMTALRLAALLTAVASSAHPLGPDRGSAHGVTGRSPAAATHPARPDTVRAEPQRGIAARLDGSHRPVPPAASTPVVLFLMPAADTQRLANGRARPTGYFLNEFYEPYRAVRDAGYAVEFASPGGRRPPIDPESLKRRYWKAHPEQLAEARALVDTLSALRAPTPLEVARRESARYAGVIVPGGQGVMVDLLGDTSAHALLRDVGRVGRPVGLICHAPALLTRLGVDGNPFLGRRVTSVSRLEEWYIERVVMKGAARDRLIGRALAQRGYRYHRALRPARPYAVRDGNLVTSQNPFSGARFTALYLEALRAADAPARATTQEVAGELASGARATP
jgi:putative intracellular protease/amidase